MRPDDLGHWRATPIRWDRYVKRPRVIPPDEWQYRDRSSSEVRTTLLERADFVRSARTCPGVARIALVGSMVTSKPRPKDVDLLVTVTADLEMPRLARLGRRLKAAHNPG